MAGDLRQRAARIRLVVFDVDGVLSDGSLYFSDDGTEIKAFNSKDGHGIKMLKSSGVDVAVITGRSSPLVTRRMQALGIEHVFQGHEDKLPVFEKLLESLDLDAEQAAYVGDDVVDLPVMRRVGLAVSVADAHPLVLEHAHWCTRNPGGNGAAREVCEQVMAAQGTLDAQLEKYLE
jgi:3-deoxy-D-manno-octulosonate 8-phosphate phosphatase (KDO 8-P phosphatase)